MVHNLWNKEPQTREMRQTLEDRFFFLGCDSLTTWASCDHMLTPAWGQFSIYVCIQSWVLILGSSTPHEESNMLFSCITPWDREPTKASLGHYCSLLCIARCTKNPNEGPNNTGSAQPLLSMIHSCTGDWLHKPGNPHNNTEGFLWWGKYLRSKTNNFFGRKKR